MGLTAWPQDQESHALPTEPASHPYKAFFVIKLVTKSDLTPFTLWPKLA